MGVPNSSSLLKIFISIVNPICPKSNSWLAPPCLDYLHISLFLWIFYPSFGCMPRKLEVSLNIIFFSIPNIQATIKTFDLTSKISWELYTFLFSIGLLWFFCLLLYFKSIMHTAAEITFEKCKYYCRFCFLKSTKDFTLL